MTPILTPEVVPALPALPPSTAVGAVSLGAALDPSSGRWRAYVQTSRMHHYYGVGDCAETALAAALAAALGRVTT